MGVLARGRNGARKTGYGQYRQWRGEVANPRETIPPIINKEPRECPEGLSGCETLIY
jgi:hypothetical protein